MPGIRSGWIVAGFAMASALLAQATESPLARLKIDGKKVGWDGVELGMSVVQAERRVGLTLAPAPSGLKPCGAFAVDVERGTLRLTLGFPSARPGAKVETLYVHFEGYQVLAKRSELIDELKRLSPQATYTAPREYPDLPEADAADPIYLLPGEAGVALRLEPGKGILLARRDCVL